MLSKRQRRAALYALIAALCIWLAYVATGTSSLQSCVSEQEDRQAGQKSQDDANEVLFSPLDRAWVFTYCGVGFLYDSRDAFTMIATVFIAVFTGTLWRATDRLWEAGERQIELASRSVAASANAAGAAVKQANIAERSLRDLERPYVFVSRLEFSIAARENDRPDLILGLTNYGRTPAIMREYGLEIEIVDRLTGEASVDTSYWKHVMSAVIAPGAELPDMKIQSVKIDNVTVTKIWEGKMGARLVLRLFYNKVFGETHVEKFWYLYDDRAGIFVRDDDRESDESGEAGLSRPTIPGAPAPTCRRLQ